MCLCVCYDLSGKTLCLEMIGLKGCFNFDVRSFSLGNISEKASAVVVTESETTTEKERACGKALTLTSPAASP